MVDFTPLPPFDVVPRGQVFLGLNPANGYRRCWANRRDAVGVIAPPGYGKTSSVVIPAVMWWDGPAVVSSTRGDVLRATGDWRARLAAVRGGRVYVFDPFASEPGVVSIRWSPTADCRDADTAYARVDAITATSGQGVSDGAYWRDGAGAILRAVLHAAALDDVDMTEVRRWLTRQDVDTPASIIRRHEGAEMMWADDIEGVGGLSDKTRSSFFSVAAAALSAYASPTVRRSAAATDIDVDEFLSTGSTLYVVGPSNQQRVLAPLLIGLIDSIATRARERAAASPGGRLDPGLLLALDEVANTPLESLPALVSEGGGAGISTLWSVQNLSQLRAKFGADGAASILSATGSKLIYGGMSNGDDLRNISGWAGEYAEAQVTQHGAAGMWEQHMATPRPSNTGGDDSGRGQRSVSTVYRPVLPVDRLQHTPEFTAWLWHRSDPPIQVETRPAGLIDSYAKHFGYTPRETS